MLNASTPAADHPGRRLLPLAAMLSAALLALPAAAQTGTVNVVKPLNPAPVNSKVRKINVDPDAAGALQPAAPKVRTLKVKEPAPEKVRRIPTAPAVQKLPGAGDAGGATTAKTPRRVPVNIPAKTAVGQPGAGAKVPVAAVPKRLPTPAISTLPTVKLAPKSSFAPRLDTAPAKRLVVTPPPTGKIAGSTREVADTKSRLQRLPTRTAPAGVVSPGRNNGTLGSLGAAGGLGRAAPLGTAPSAFGAARLNRAANRADVLEGGSGIYGDIAGEGGQVTSDGMTDEQEAADLASVLGQVPQGEGTTVDDYRGSHQEGTDGDMFSIDRRQTGAAQEAADALLQAGVQAGEDGDGGGNGGDGGENVMNFTLEESEQDREAAGLNDNEMSFSAEEDEQNQDAADEEQTAGQQEGDETMSFGEEEVSDDTDAWEEEQQAGDDDGAEGDCAPGDSACTGDTGMSVAGGEDDPPPSGDCGENGQNCVGDHGPGGGSSTVRTAGMGAGGPLAADPVAGLNPAVDIVGDGGLDAEHLDRARLDAILQDRLDPGR